MALVKSEICVWIVESYCQVYIRPLAGYETYLLLNFVTAKAEYPATSSTMSQPPMMPKPGSWKVRFCLPSLFFILTEIHIGLIGFIVLSDNNQLGRKPEESSENMRSYVYHVCCVLNFLWASVNGRQRFVSNWQHEVSNAMDTFGCCFGR